MQIRAERPGDAEWIGALVEAAFADAEHGDGTEAGIVERLRKAGALSLSLVADEGDGPVGHVAFSPVTIDGRDEGWFGLGPLAVTKARRDLGIGSALVREGLDRLARTGAMGCVVLGEPGYYGRFGFEARKELVFPGPPARYFQALRLGGEPPAGLVAYHPAFG